MNVADIGSIATAAGVAFAAWQVAAQRTQFRTSFQDGLWREQRDLIARMPLEFVLTPPEASEPFSRMLSDDEMTLMFRYFDLSNEQALYAQRGRIGRHSWRVWRDAMLMNMGRPAFAAAWDRIGPARSTSQFGHFAAVLDGTHRLPLRREPIRR